MHHDHPVATWVAAGVLFGVASALLAQVCLLAVPAWPGALLVSALGGGNAFGEILTDGGARLELLVPANAVVYGAIGALIGFLKADSWERRTAGPLRCTKCRYPLSGNTSGVCPECGTPLSPSQRRQLPKQRNRHPDGG
jgi:hypothetical protein